MRVQVTEDVGHAVVRPIGELDTASVEPLAEALRAAFAGGRPLVVLDLEAVTFVDSTVVTALLRERETARSAGVTLRLAAATTPVARVLQMLGVARELDVHATVAEAVAG